MALFLAVVWYGSTPNFVLFGVIHGLGVMVVRMYGDALKTVLGRDGMKQYLGSASGRDRYYHQLRVFCILVLPAWGAVRGGPASDRPAQSDRLGARRVGRNPRRVCRDSDSGGQVPLIVLFPATFPADGWLNDPVGIWALRATVLQDRHHRGVASAIDDCPIRVLVSLKRDWRSPLGDDTLSVSQQQVPPAWKENAIWTGISDSTPTRQAARSGCS